MLSPNIPAEGRDRFAVCLRETLKWEGGWSNHPKDPGGATMRGVIQRVYNGWRDQNGLPRRSVRLIEEHELQAIYRKNYWDMIRGSELPPGIDLAVLDFCVNSGPGQAVKSLQRVMGLARDGHLGAATMAAIHRHDPAQLVTKYMAERERFLRSLRTFPTFGRGWISRVNGVRSAAAVMAGESRWDIVNDAAPAHDPDVQSEGQGRATAEDPAPPIGTELALATGGTGGVGNEVANAFTAMGYRGDFSVRGFLIALLSSPTFWIALIALIAAAYTFLWRRRHAQ